MAQTPWHRVLDRCPNPQHPIHDLRVALNLLARRPNWATYGRVGYLYGYTRLLPHIITESQDGLTRWRITDELQQTLLKMTVEDESHRKLLPQVNAEALMMLENLATQARVCVEYELGEPGGHGVPHLIMPHETKRQYVGMIAFRGTSKRVILADTLRAVTIQSTKRIYRKRRA